MAENEKKEPVAVKNCYKKTNVFKLNVNGLNG